MLVCPSLASGRGACFLIAHLDCQEKDIITLKMMSLIMRSKADTSIIMQNSDACTLRNVFQMAYKHAETRASLTHGSIPQMRALCLLPNFACQGLGSVACMYAY